MITTPAASAVTSLFCPIAMPTVAAIMAGASLMPSHVECFSGGSFRADDRELFFRTLLRMDVRDAHLFRQVPHLRLAIARGCRFRKPRG